MMLLLQEMLSQKSSLASGFPIKLITSIPTLSRHKDTLILDGRTVETVHYRNEKIVVIPLEGDTFAQKCHPQEETFIKNLPP